MIDPTGIPIDLARLGSLEYQRLWCVTGVGSDYILLDELLDSVLNRIDAWAGDPEWSAELTGDERRTLQDFAAVAYELLSQIPWTEEGVTVQQIVERDPNMAKIRDAANAAVAALGISFTHEQIMDE